MQNVCVYNINKYFHRLIEKARKSIDGHHRDTQFICEVDATVFSSCGHEPVADIVNDECVQFPTVLILRSWVNSKAAGRTKRLAKRLQINGLSDD